MSEPQTNHSQKRMPVLFVGHGSPMNAIEDNPWSRGFRSLTQLLPKPRAILAISAHWYVAGTFTTGNALPPTIHDFGGFPPELYEIEYPAPGDIKLASDVLRLLSSDSSDLKENWGIDHGTWSVLRHIFPDADYPVVQLSIDKRLSPDKHLLLGTKLSQLREQGVLIMGSGNIVHNLRDAFERYDKDDLTTPDWALDFDNSIVDALKTFNSTTLTNIIETKNGRMAHPTLDHYLPLLYAVGAANKSDTVRFPIEGFDMGSLSMRAAIWI
jgi:4,5-DOPA dioxygenase extradiol